MGREFSRRDLIGRTLSGRYEIREVLGQGGMGTVYEGTHVGLGRPVAIKVLSPSQTRKRVAVKRFQQEARAAGAIGHPNICEIYDLGQLDDGRPYLVMERLVGRTFAERILRERGLPYDDVLSITAQVLSGLVAAHDKGIVHRDIKPENVFLAERIGAPPIVKILDFGVSKILASESEGGDEQLSLTRTGMVMGTPYYMSPEQARGERNLDGRVDVYACGVMMYEALTGKRPFLAPNYNALLLAIINGTPRPIRQSRPDVPPALEALVARAMTKARDQRYPSAQQFLREIQSLVSLSAPPAPPRVAVATSPATPHGAWAPDARHRPAAASASVLREPPDPRRSPSAPAHDPTPALLGRFSTVTASELVALDVAPSSAFGDELPTEVFRPQKHPAPGAAPWARTAAPAEPAPTTVRGQDEWDVETVVHVPDFNPDDTVRIEREALADDTQISPRPPRR